MLTAEIIALDVIRTHAPVAMEALPSLLGLRGVRPESAEPIVNRLLRRGAVHIDTSGLITVREPLDAA